MLAAASPAPTRQAPPAAELRQTLQTMIADHRLPNAQVIIAQDGKTLAAFRLGDMDVERKAPLPADAIFRLYSMSKPITSVAAMMLVEQGKLSLDDPVSRYLPAFADMRVYQSGDLDHMVTVPAARPITIRDLLTHSSGLTYQFMGDTPVQQYYRRFGAMRDTAVGKRPGDAPPARDLAQLVDRLGNAPLLHQPGDRFSYGYSTTMLGAVIERASGESLDVFLKRHIFDPLDMPDTGFVVSDAQLPRFVTLYTATADGIAPVETAAASEYRDPARLRDGGGALAGTARDYLHFAEMLANGGIWHGHRLLSSATVTEMMQPHLPTGGKGLEDTQFGYGFAIGDAHSQAIGGLPVGTASWSGSGNTYFFVDPRRHMVALLMTNELASGERTETLRKAIDRAALRLRR